MSDSVVLTFGIAAPVAAAASFLMALKRSRQHSWMRRLTGSGCAALAMGIAILLIPFAWVLRDGMAPGMIVSQGGSAIAHFAVLYAIALFPAGAFALIALALLHTRKKKEKKEA